MKTLITGGTIVTHSEAFPADILLQGGRIAALGRDLAGQGAGGGAQIVNAEGRYILPGAIDPHTHITLNADCVRGTDAYFSGTLPALAGGTTTIVDHLAFSNRSLQDQLAVYHSLADGFSAVDYGFHGVIQHVDDAVLAGLADIAAAGYTSVKAYMTYDFRLKDDELLRLLRRTAELGMILPVHAENHWAITQLRAECKAAGHGEPIWHARSRPAHCEAEAVSGILHLAALAGDAPVYIVHLSTALGLAEIRKARAQGQKNIYAETCTQYLTLTEDLYLNPETGLEALMSPPLRAREDVEALWQGLRDGDIQTVGTDHCTFTRKDKERGRGDFMRCPGGAPGIEERLAVLFSEGVSKGRIDSPTLVRALCAEPAKLFGLWPRKGSLAPGADADLVIIDPAAVHRLRLEDLHGPGDYSLYAGMDLQGRVETVFLRGNPVFRQGVVHARPGLGRFLKRGRGTG